MSSVVMLQQQVFGWRKKNEAEFCRLLGEYFCNDRASLEYCAQFRYDTQAQLDEMNPELMRWMAQLEPFGVGFEEPVFLFENLTLSTVTPLKDGAHYKLKLSSKAEGSKNMDGLWFSPPKNHKVKPGELKEGDCVRVLAAPQWNEFNGQRTLQLHIKDLKHER